jgi:prevent-host-death family protein
MKVASVLEMKADFVVYLKAREQKPVIVTRKGKPVAVLLGAKNQEELERLIIGHAPKLQEILEAVRKRFRSGGGIPHEVFWHEVETEKANRSTKRRVMPKTGLTKR